MVRIFLGCTLFLLTGCQHIHKGTSVVSVSDTIENKMDKMLGEWDAPNMPGGSVALVKDGKIIFMKGYGYANLENHDRNTPETRFYMASVSKQFTGYCIARLIDEGKLSLDDDIRTLLPELSAIPSPVRVRDLVYHKSGMRDYMGLIPLLGHSLNDYVDNKGVMRLLSHQHGLNFSPGERWQYSNTNYFLLGEIVERITGKSLKEYAEEVIFSPLDMKHTLFVDSIETLVPERADSYHQARDGKITNDPFLDVTDGHTGLYATAEDMAKWIIHMRSMILDGDAAFARMRQRDTLNSGGDIPYAFGLFITEPPLNYWHRGSLFGYKCILSYYPQLDFGLVMLGNVQRFNRIRYAREVMQWFYPDQFPQIPDKNGLSIPDSIRSRRFHPDHGILLRCSGNYVMNPMLVYVISPAGENLEIHEWGEEGKTTLVYLGDNRFRDVDNTLLVTFYENQTHGVDSLTYHSDSDSITGIKAKSLTAQEEDEVTGTYYNDELDMRVIILRDSLGLVVRTFALGEIRMIPTYPETFRCKHDFFSYIVMTRNVNRKVEGFLLSGFSINNVRFEKQ